MFLLRMKVRLSPERITGSLYRRRPDMSTSAGMPAQRAACPGCGKTFTQGDAGAEYVIISKGNAAWPRCAGTGI